jgi:Amt family ammonium transporter
MLWVGWFGFNAGSAVAANGSAGMAMLVTQIAAATAGIAWMLIEWFSGEKKPSLLGMCSGAVAGLVAITPASGFVGPSAAFFIGLAAGVICYLTCTKLKSAFGYDDSLDVFGIHALGGALGAILTGVFTSKAIGGTAGLLEGNAAQVKLQLIGVGVTLLYTAIVTYIILKVVDLITPLRASDSNERDGLDLSQHGEQIN